VLRPPVSGAQNSLRPPLIAQYCPGNKCSHRRPPSCSVDGRSVSRLSIRRQLSRWLRSAGGRHRSGPSSALPPIFAFLSSLTPLSCAPGAESAASDVTHSRQQPLFSNQAAAKVPRHLYHLRPAGHHSSLEDERRSARLRRAKTYLLPLQPPQPPRSPYPAPRASGESNSGKRSGLEGGADGRFR